LLKRIGHEIKRNRRNDVQINVLAIGGGRLAVSFDSVAMSFEPDVARRLKIDPVTLIAPKPKWKGRRTTRKRR
jgi:hypothetical protein